MRWGAADGREVVASGEPTLRARRPAFALVRECVRIQRSRAPRSRLARLLGASPLHPNARSWYRGALGELAIADDLEHIDDGWSVLHSVPQDDGLPDIDHLAIGPGGVFTIHTKNHADARVLVDDLVFVADGRAHDHVAQALADAERASDRLGAAAGVPVPVRPVLVVARPEKLTVRSSPVAVVGDAQLAPWLRAQHEVLSVDEVLSLARIAERRSTWTTRAHAASESIADVLEFDRLRREVDAALARQRAWLLALLTVGVVVMPPAVLALWSGVGA